MSASQTPSLPATLIDAATRAELSKMYANFTQQIELHTYVLRATSPANGSGKAAVKVGTDQHEALYEEFSVRLCSELASTSPHMQHIPHVGEKTAFGEKIQFFPTILLVVKGQSKPLFRMTGAPLGEESRTLVQALDLLGHGTSTLSDTAITILSELKTPRHVRVFSSPGCPYCPGQAINALKAAMQRPDFVTAECVTADEYPEYAAKYNVGSVPHTQFTEDHAGVGLMTEAAFIHELTHLAPLPLGPILNDAQAQELDLVILGGGPTGLSAAIYAARSGLDSVVLERESFGGQINVTPTVENYPGFASIGGTQLGEILTAHARQYAPLVRTSVQAIMRDYVFSVHTPERIFKAKALLFATGAEWKNLDVPGEHTFFGKGVVHCASCDGYMYKGKAVIVVGGGNTALTDALHLKNLGVSVTILHRRDAFRAEDALQKAVEREGIPVVWNSIATEVLGNKSVTGLRIKNTVTGAESTLSAAGIFIAVGQKPNTELAVPLGVALDSTGAIIVDAELRTNVPGIYAAGDVCGGTQQIVTAVSAGARAALSIFEDLQKEKA